MSFQAGYKFSGSSTDFEAGLRFDLMQFKIHYAKILLTGMAGRKRKLKRIKSRFLSE